MKNHILLIYYLFFLIFISSCKNEKEPLFTLLNAERTGIYFKNLIKDTDTLNIQDYLYYYNGGGVAIGDLNNDGLPDVYFISNQGSNKLYLNKGDLKFEDITDGAGVKGAGNWKTGVTLADVNGDGLLDIYISEVGGYKNFIGRNELYINNGDLTFSERAHEYGLDIEGFNTQAVFFDYDHDNDLDMFLVNHSVHSNSSYGNSSMRQVKNEAAGDKLFRNDKTEKGRKFIEVTTEAGIYSGIIGYGLNVVVGDLNNDNWDDIYVSNDFHENDYYYVNNKNGTFSEINSEAFGHESRFSMGSAIADMNNDGWLDIITLDMLPSEEKILKSSAGSDPLDIYNFKLSYGYHYQYARNCLQLNRGGGEKFSDIALFSGIAATDWSWSPLAADFDNDGIKDIFISNGILRRPNDLDFIKYYSNRNVSKINSATDLKLIEKMPKGEISNYIYKGTDSLKFIDKTYSWGFNQPGLSNGAVSADLDNDGDLDIVTNNINSFASIYKNNTVEQQKNHYLDLQLKGLGDNKFSIGAKVILKKNDNIQTDYLSATKGFESSSLQNIHFGTGSDTIIDEIQVIWPDGKSQVLNNVETDQHLVVSYGNAVDFQKQLLPSKQNQQKIIFKDITDSVQVSFRHHEDQYNDFNTEALIPQMVSTQGPKIAVADIDGDGLEDFYVSGAKNQAGSLFRQTSSGAFIPTNLKLLEADALCEDINAIFFDANDDDSLDLYVVSGGNETQNKEYSLLDRLYINDGQGNFTKSKTLPLLYGNKSVSIAADFDKDGDMDLFIGGRVVAGRYGDIPNSYLLINDGKGNFSVAQDLLAPGLCKIGMVTDAIWSDIDKDNWVDLIIVGRWMPITIFKNEKGKLKNITSDLGLENTSGLWNTLHLADLNSDGNSDLLVGNLGENSKLHASEEYPLKLYISDMDGNGDLDQILAIEKNGKYFPFLGKEILEKQLPSIIKKKYPNYSSFAGQTISEIFGEKLNRAKLLSVSILSSIALINDGDGKYSISNLPKEAQWSTIFSFYTDDFNLDGKTDIITAGNFYGVSPYEGRYDGGYGNVLLSTGFPDFDVLSPFQSGFMTSGEVRDMKKINLCSTGKCLIVSRNNNTLLFSAWE